MQQLITVFQALERFAQHDLATVIGTTALNFYKDSWSRQGYINTRYSRWPARQLGSARNSRRGLLTDSGHLRNSMRSQVHGHNIVISNTRPYAKVHNEGGVVTVTPKMAKYFWYMHKQTGKNESSWKYMALAKTITIPQRQYMDIEGQPMSPFLERRMVRVIDHEIDGIMRRYGVG